MFHILQVPFRRCAWYWGLFILPAISPSHNQNNVLGESDLFCNDYSLAVGLVRILLMPLFEQIAPLSHRYHCAGTSFCPRIILNDLLVDHINWRSHTTFVFEGKKAAPKRFPYLCLRWPTCKIIGNLCHYHLGLSNWWGFSAIPNFCKYALAMKDQPQELLMHMCMQARFWILVRPSHSCHIQYVRIWARDHYLTSSLGLGPLPFRNPLLTLYCTQERAS